MAKLIEFKSTEAGLFEALSVIFFTSDQPSPAETKASIKAEDLFEKYGILTKDSKFKTVSCSFCGQRIAVVPRIYTLPEGKGADLILDDKVFEYMDGRFEKWQVITDPAMKRPFDTLRDRFAEAKANKKLDDLDSIMEYLKART